MEILSRTHKKSWSSLSLALFLNFIDFESQRSNKGRVNLIYINTDALYVDGYSFSNSVDVVILWIPAAKL